MTQRQRRVVTVAVVAGLVLGACGGREAVWSRGQSVLGPVPLAGHLAWLDASLEDLVTVQAVAKEGGFDFEVVRQPVGRQPVLLRASADKTRALVVTHGTLGGAGYEEEDERLYVMDPAGRAAPVIYPLRSPFDALALSEDGRWAVAYFATDDAVNPNEMAVTRLDETPGESNPVLLPIRTYGSRPLGVHYLLDLTIGGADRQLALIFSQRYVTFADLEHLDRRVTTVFVSPMDSTEVVVPADAVVAAGDATDPEGATPYVFLRAPGIAAVYALNLKDNTPPPEPDQNDFTPSVNEIPVPAPPDDFAVFDGAGGKSLLAVHSRGRTPGVTVIDPRTTSTWTVDLDAPAVAVRIFTGVPTRDGIRQIALLLNVGNAYETRAGFLVLDGIEERLQRNLDTVDLGAPVMDVIPTGDPLRVLLVHNAVTGSLSILDVADRTVERLGVEVRTGRLATHPEGDSFFFASPVPNRISQLTLDTGHAEDIRLDADPVGLYALPGATSGTAVTGRALFVDHGWRAGYVTALPLDAPDRNEAASIQGFLADGFIDVDTGRYPSEEVP
jgi:hypothetical protein